MLNITAYPYASTIQNWPEVMMMWSKKMKSFLPMVVLLALVIVVVPTLSDVDAAESTQLSASWTNDGVLIKGTAPSWAQWMEFDIVDSNNIVIHHAYYELKHGRSFSLTRDCDVGNSGTVVSYAKAVGVIKETNVWTIEFPRDIPTVRVNLSPSIVEMTLGDQPYKVTISVYPSNHTDDITWSSTNVSVATVDQDGNITAVKAGTTKIVATSGSGKIGECQVNVRNAPSEDPIPGVEREYTFEIKIMDPADASRANAGSWSVQDLLSGFSISAKGTDAAEALTTACNEKGIPVQLNPSGEYKGWVGHMFGLGDENLGDGSWRYWIQYHDGTYNQWTLGHYTDGGTFTLTYGITIEAEVPEVTTSFEYDGKEHAPVSSGDGYTIANDQRSTPKATAPGEYVVRLELNEKYIWSDGTVAPKEFRWAIIGSSDDDPFNPGIDIKPAPEDHLDPTDPTVTVEKDSIQNADGTITNVQTLTKTEEDGKTTTTVITTTPQNDGTVEEIKSTSNSQTNEGGIKTESSLETVTIKDPNGGVKSETHIEVSVIDTTGSSGTGTKGVTITANDKGGNATVKAEYQEGSQSASVVTEVKTSEENGQVVISHESLDVALKMQEMYSKKIVNENESVKDATKVIQVGSGSSDANVKLSSDIVKKIADADSAILVSGTAGSMEVSKTVMSNISEYDDIAISVAKAIEDVLTDEQRIAINSDATVVKVKVMSGDKSIGDKLNGEITISIKHITAPGMVPVAYYVHDDGTMEKVDGKYNMKNNEMVVKTTHCSIYAVIDEAPESSSDGNILLYAGIAIAAVIIIAAIATFMLRRR